MSYLTDIHELLFDIEWLVLREQEDSTYLMSQLSSRISEIYNVKVLFIFFCHGLYRLLKSHYAHYFSLWLHQISDFHCNIWNVFLSPQCKGTTLLHSHVG